MFMHMYMHMHIHVFIYICICIYGLKTHWIVFVNKKLLECNVCVHIYTGICVYFISFGSIIRKETC